MNKTCEQHRTVYIYSTVIDISIKVITGCGYYTQLNSIPTSNKVFTICTNLFRKCSPHLSYGPLSIQEIDKHLNLDNFHFNAHTLLEYTAIGPDHYHNLVLISLLTDLTYAITHEYLCSDTAKSSHCNHAHCKLPDAVVVVDYSHPLQNHEVTEGKKQTNTQKNTTTVIIDSGTFTRCQDN